MVKNVSIKVNKNAGKELAKEMQRNMRKKGVHVQVDPKELQKAIEKMFR